MNKNKLVSYCLFTYNQENFIESAIRGALNQTYSPLEIIISDDCSSDSTFKIVREIVKNYSGPHHVILNRNNENLGLGKHFSNVVYDIASGDYLIIIAGDDISKQNHVDIAVDQLEKYPDVQMIDFSGEIIDENGKIIRKILLDYEIKVNTLRDYLSLRNVDFFAPGRIITRQLLDYFEPLSSKCPTEDSVLVLRSLMMGGFMRINKDVIYYRRHTNNISSSSGLAKLSNLSIVAQYLKDILFLYDKGVIDEMRTNLLLTRVDLEYKLRFLNFSKRLYKVHSFTRPFLKVVYKLIYKLKTNSKINNI